MYRSTPALILALLLLAPLSLGAQEAEMQGAVSCFDHYTFGSVQASFVPGVLSTVSGVPISFTGNIKNNNPYPVVNGALYIKVFRLRADVGEKNVNGPYVVDQFFVKKGVSIPAGGSMPLSFSWQIPANAINGEYQIASFFVTSEKFNLLGLSFTDDVIGNTARFSVEAERNSGVEWNKDSVTVNEIPYRFAAFPPRADSKEPVVVGATIQNKSTEEARVLVTWRLNKWDAQSEANRIDVKEEVITIPAGGSKRLSYESSDSRYSVYLLEGSMQWKDTKSFINVRYVREGIIMPRLNFPAVKNFPLKAGEEATVFSCYHNTSEDTLPAQLRMTIRDFEENIIHEYDYVGEISGDMAAAADQFTPLEDYDRFVLDTQLIVGESVVDTSRVVYDCEKIDPTLCAPEQGILAQVLKQGETLKVLGGGLLAIVVIALLGIWAYRRQDPDQFTVVPIKDDIR